MATGSTITTLGKNTALYRLYTENGSLSSTQYLAPSRFKVGVGNGTPSVTSTDLDDPIPITNGTVLADADENMTGSDGGDNSTDNTTTYKEGAGVSDATSQNLIANNTNVSKVWTIADLSANGSNAAAAQYTGLNIYIKDATALAKFKSSGTALEIRLGSDTSNYYYKQYTAADLSTGWNWLSLGILNTLSENGTVSGNIDTFVIVITTNNSTDEFTTGDVLFDLLRQWQYSDTIKTFEASYPTFDYTNNEVTIRCKLLTTEANGFLLNGFALVNQDSSPLLISEDTFIADSKSSSDEFRYIVRDRLI